MARNLLIKTMCKFRTVTWSFAIDLPYAHTCMIQISKSSVVLYIPPRFLVFHIPLTFALAEIKNIKNRHAVSTDQIAEILHLIN